MEWEKAVPDLHWNANAIGQIKALLIGSSTVRRLLRFVRKAPQPAEHAVKQAAILKLAQKYETKIFVETGTFRGDMVEAVKRQFDKVYSIELSHEFYSAAKERFAADANVEILHGDSGEKLREIMPLITAPCLFWLDGHFSGGNTAKGLVDTPILAELDHILTAPEQGHVILIDDARLFGRDPSYPTVKAVMEVVSQRRPGLQFEIADDAIRVLPSASSGNPGRPS